MSSDDKADLVSIFQSEYDARKKEIEKDEKRAERKRKIASASLKTARIQLQKLFETVPKEMCLSVTEIDEESEQVNWQMLSRRFDSCKYEFRILAAAPHSIRKENFFCTIWTWSGRELIETAKFQSERCDESLKYMAAEMGKIVGDEMTRD